MIHICKEVVALIPYLMSNVYGKAQRHGCMTSITSALVELSEFAISSCLKFGRICGDNEVAQEFCQAVGKDRIVGTWILECAYLVVLDSAKTLIIDENIIA